MKYAQLPLRMREGEEERSGCLAVSAGAEKPLGMQLGQWEEGLGEMQGPFPPEGSDGELVMTLEIISAGC